MLLNCRVSSASCRVHVPPWWAGPPNKRWGRLRRAQAFMPMPHAPFMHMPNPLTACRPDARSCRRRRQPPRYRCWPEQAWPVSPARRARCSRGAHSAAPVYAAAPMPAVPVAPLGAHPAAPCRPPGLAFCARGVPGSLIAPAPDAGGSRRSRRATAPACEVPSAASVSPCPSLGSAAAAPCEASNVAHERRRGSKARMSASLEKPPGLGWSLLCLTCARRQNFARPRFRHGQLSKILAISDENSRAWHRC